MSKIVYAKRLQRTKGTPVAAAYMKRQGYSLTAARIMLAMPNLTATKQVVFLGRTV